MRAGLKPAPPVPVVALSHPLIIPQAFPSRSRSRPTITAAVTQNQSGDPGHDRWVQALLSLRFPGSRPLATCRNPFDGGRGSQERRNVLWIRQLALSTVFQDGALVPGSCRLSMAQVAEEEEHAREERHEPGSKVYGGAIAENFESRFAGHVDDGDF